MKRLAIEMLDQNPKISPYDNGAISDVLLKPCVDAGDKTANQQDDDCYDDRTRREAINAQVYEPSGKVGDGCDSDPSEVDAKRGSR